jgi:hypothetical protein
LGSDLPTLPTWLQRIPEISALEIWLRVHVTSDCRVVTFVKFETTDASPLFGVSGNIGLDVVKEFDFAVWPLPNYRVGEMQQYVHVQRPPRIRSATACAALAI